MKKKLKFKNSVIVLDDMGDKFNKDIVYYFTEGKSKDIQMNVMYHKPAQIDIMSRMNCGTFYITTYNGADLFKKFTLTYKCDHDFHGVIQELNNSYYNCTDGTDDALRYGLIKYNKKEETFIIIDRNRTMIYDSRVGFLDIKAFSLNDELESNEIHKLIAYIKLLLINATNRAVDNTDNYQFYFNNLLTSNNIKLQNDVLTKKKIVCNWRMYIGGISGGLSALFIYT